MNSQNPLANFIEPRLLQCPQYARLLARLRRQDKDVQSESTIAGLTDSAKSLLLSGMLSDLRQPLFFVVSDSHQAAFYERELNDICEYPVLTYPASEISPYEQVLSSPDNIAAQMQVLYRLLGKQRANGGEEPSDQARQRLDNDPYLVIVPARALMQRVLDKETLLANTFSLKVGEDIDRDELAHKLIGLGYTRESLVTLRGEFSIRGDIVDIYPSAFEPVRIELFGDQIESIRSFKIDDQRSIEQKNSISIGPRYWVVLGDEEGRQKFIQTIEAVTEKQATNLSAEAIETLNSVIEGDKEAFAANGYPESVEYYAPYIHKQFSTLLDYFPDSALLAFDEWDSIMLSLNAYHEKLEKSYAEGLETGRLLPIPERLHLDVSKCADKLKSLRRMFFTSLPELAQANVKVHPYESGEKTFPKDIAIVDRIDTTRDNKHVSGAGVVQFDCQPVEHFNNQLKLVVEKIKIWQAAGIAVLINSDQPQRIMDLLREWDCYQYI